MAPVSVCGLTVRSSFVSEALVFLLSAVCGYQRRARTDLGRKKKRQNKNLCEPGRLMRSRSQNRREETRSFCVCEWRPFLLLFSPLQTLHLQSFSLSPDSTTRSDQQKPTAEEERSKSRAVSTFVNRNTCHHTQKRENRKEKKKRERGHTQFGTLSLVCDTHFWCLSVSTLFCRFFFRVCCTSHTLCGRSHRLIRSCPFVSGFNFF